MVSEMYGITSKQRRENELTYRTCSLEWQHHSNLFSKTEDNYIDMVCPHEYV